jgi:hypothetical protein
MHFYTGLKHVYWPQYGRVISQYYVLRFSCILAHYKLLLIYKIGVQFPNMTFMLDGILAMEVSYLKPQWKEYIILVSNFMHLQHRAKYI